MVPIAFVYLWGLIGFLLIASWISNNLATAMLAVAPFLLIIKLAVTDPEKEKSPSGTGTNRFPAD
jgi:hypothetical protein